MQKQIFGYKFLVTVIVVIRAQNTHKNDRNDSFY